MFVGWVNTVMMVTICCGLKECINNWSVCIAYFVNILNCKHYCYKDMSCFPATYALMSYTVF